MKKIIVTLLLVLIIKVGIAQNYNPAVNSGVMTPAPLSNGVGECQFNVGNTGSDPLNNLAQPMVLIITLSYGLPNNSNPISAISGTYANKFNWLYDAGTKTYQGTQNQIIIGYGLGSIKIAYRVTTASNSSNPQNGFNVNVTPPAYTNTSNTAADDNVSSYTYGSPLGGPLPIELTSFAGKCEQQNTILTWSTATEINNKNFTLERSLEGINWELVGTIAGAGSSSVSRTYSFKDNLPAKSINYYYRLKQTDFDNNIKYGNIIIVKNCGGSTADNLSIFPNPSNGKFSLLLTGDQSKVSSTEVFNAQGRKIYQSNIFQSKIDLSNKPAGVYLVRVLLNSKMITSRIVVEK